MELRTQRVMQARRAGRLRAAGPSMLVAFVLCLALGGNGAGLKAAAEGGLEYDVKAAMVYNFAKFTDWPASAWKDGRAPMVLCVVGATAFDENLERAVESQSFEGRVIRVQKLASIAEADACHVVYVGRSESKRLGEILRPLENKPILTVSDSDKFTREGGMIGLVTVDNKVRFNINPARASKTGITISSKLLKLAHTVENGGGN
jgi:YfiR/HmsC-like